jgi:hypothetical protein
MFIRQNSRRNFTTAKDYKMSDFMQLGEPADQQIQKVAHGLKLPFKEEQAGQNSNNRFLPRVDPPVESSEGDTSSTCNTRGFKAATTAMAGQTAVSTTTAYNMTTLN